LLDEPLANLDPVARRDLMRALLDAATEAALTVVISSHVVAELEGACDYLVILQRGRVQVTGDIDDLLSRHIAVVGPSAAAAELDPARVIHVEHVGGVARVAMSGPDPILDPRWTPSPLRLEELILAYLQSPDASALPGPERAVA
jgi:ABC-2 type transport system ATP-binding protein